MKPAPTEITGPESNELRHHCTELNGKHEGALDQAATWRTRGERTPEPLAAACHAVADLYDALAGELLSCIGFYILTDDGAREAFVAAAGRAAALLGEISDAGLDCILAEKELHR